jgi:hypothetical protein
MRKMNVHNFLEKKNINSSTEGKILIKNVMKNNKIDKNQLQPSIKSLGKGKWLLSFVFIEKDSITILGNKEYSRDILKTIIDSDIYAKIKFSGQFWRSKKNDIEKKKMVLEEDATFKISFKTEKNDDGEIGNLEIKVEGFLKKTYYSSILDKIFELCDGYFIYFDLDIQLFLNEQIVKFYFDGHESKIKLKINRKIIKRIEKMFLVKIVKIPFYCLWYVYITDILGEDFRNSKRKGFIIKEYMINDQEKVENFCF